MKDTYRTYRIADKNIGIASRFSFVHVYCLKYRTDNAPDFEVEITEQDINSEREKTDVKGATGGWLEVFAAYRKIAEVIPKYDRFLLHGSAVSVDGEGYLFTAKSGTGKSTHARLWREMLGDRAVMVNDDKPIIGIFDGMAKIYGTPYDGKERLSNNIAVPLKAVCILERSETNQIREISAREAYPIIFQQTYHPSNPEMLNRTLELLDKMSGLVKFYRLGCNMEREAVEISYNAMRGKN